MSTFLDTGLTRTLAFVSASRSTTTQSAEAESCEAIDAAVHVARKYCHSVEQLCQNPQWSVLPDHINPVIEVVARLPLPFTDEMLAIRDWLRQRQDNPDYDLKLNPWKRKE